MTITLYDCATAPSPRRARILLAEKGVAHDTLHVDLANGEQLLPAYRAIDPMCTVPALRVETGEVLTDNTAIAAYVEARFPEPHLLGTAPLDKADIARVVRVRPDERHANLRRRREAMALRPAMRL